MLAIYKTSKLNALIAKKIIICKYISLPNIIAQKEIVTEILQDNLTVDNLYREVINLANNQQKQKYIKHQLSLLKNVLQVDKQDMNEIINNLLV